MLNGTNITISQSNQSLSEVSEFDELEARSLIAAELKGPDEKLQSRATVFQRRQIQIIFLLSICAILTLFKESIVSEEMTMVKEQEEGNRKVKDPMEQIRSLVMKGKQNFDAMLEQDYGEYKDKVFEKSQILSYFKYPSEQSLERLRRRIKIKLIESQIMYPQSKSTTFIWAVGGHSAAAGHGNLFRNAYANVIEESLKLVFDPIGIQFLGKNYAMGGTKSGPEVAFCMESIFGRDVDILSWDYGMTDGRSVDLYNLWVQRANTLNSRPILFSYGQRYSDGIHGDLEQNAGGAGFEMNFGNVRSQFPNSDDPEVDVETLPRGVKNYICNNGHVEAGEPCGSAKEKFNTQDVCKKVGYQTSWHSGWKEHLLIGRISAAFIIENLLQALDEMMVEHVKMNESGDTYYQTPYISKASLNHLLDQEKQDKESFQQSNIPSNIYGKELELPGDLNDTNFDLFHRSQSICRTALLPNQARYDGIVTRTGLKSEYMFGGKYRYKDEGYDISKLPAPEPDIKSEIMLVFNHKGNRNICEHAEIDFKDFFFARYSDNWIYTLFPSKEEISYFDHTSDLHGMIILCSLIFDWNRYPADYTKITEMITDDPDFGIYVNDIKVTEVSHIANDRCYILKHKDDVDGYYFPQSTLHPGQYELRFRVPKQDANLHLSSMIVM
jgi:hypothetical protein